MVANRVSDLRERLSLDIIIANGENAAGGAGITKRIADDLHNAGVDAITLGDHTWDQRGFDDEIGDIPFLCRPANLPPQCPGRTFLLVERNGMRLGVFTVLGRQFMKIRAECPFQRADAILQEHSKACDAIVAEIHAEVTSEKIAMGWYLDGRVSLVAGTHTHVATADARVLPRGTGYISDMGMSGPHESVLGREIAPVVGGFLDGMPRRFPVAEGDVRLNGVLCEFNPQMGTCISIERFEEQQLED